MINIELALESLPCLLKGALVSLQIAAFSCSIGLFFGTLFGLAQEYAPTPIRWFVNFYVTIIRGTPMLIQIFIAFYVLPQLGIHIPAFWAAVIAIGFNSSAYISNIVRSGIASIGKGQLEAAQVLGFSFAQTMHLIILPQALRIMLPALGNEFITLIKDSALASIIGVVELSKEGSIIRSRTYDSLTIFALIAVIYLVMTSTLSLCIHYFERRINNSAGK
jgi:His/Glu/Gln/Arg/opine family amino acid ABC transporter permease subunit